MPNNNPSLVVRARVVSNSFLSVASTLTDIPGYMFVPMAGLRFNVVGLQSRAIEHGGVPQLNYAVITNSSGIGEQSVPIGNFTVHAYNGILNFTASLRFSSRATTYLNLSVVPVYGTVSSIAILNQDTLSGVEPTAVLYAVVSGNSHFESSSITEVKGSFGAPLTTSGPQFYATFELTLELTINATIIGSYSTPQGTLVVLRPSGYYPTLPTTNIVLFQYRTDSSVSYGAT